MKLLTIAIILISLHSHARVMNFGHVTPFTEQSFELKVETSKSNINDQLIRFRLTNLPHNKDVFLIKTREHRMSFEQKFREEIWEQNIKRNHKTRINTGYSKYANNPIVSIVKLKPETPDKYGISSYIIDVGQDEMESAYIYIDYASQVFGGGYYYSIDLKEYLPEN